MLNYSFYFYITYKKIINLCFRFKAINKLANKLKKLIIIY